ncbi:MAG: DsbA family oxidoreductase [Sphingomonadaceae bacterium]
MSTPLTIDFVSDISCPWCAIGMKALEQAIANIGEDASISVHYQPFELNPAMGPQGQDITEHITEKYGATPEQQAQNREAIRARGAAVGFDFAMDQRSRIYNTFDAHRLLHWAELEGRQAALKEALFSAYFTRGEDPSSQQVLVKTAALVGLDPELATEVLATGRYADEVREREQFFQRHGINSVPAVIINQRHLISGGQPPEVFERALRDILSKA